MGETDNMEDTGATLIKNGNEKVVFTKNKDLTNEEEHEVTDVDRMEEDNFLREKSGRGKVEYKMYPQRWWVLLTAVGIQIFNFAHFAAFPSVNKVMSKYYHQSGDKMDWIVSSTVLLRGPMCILILFVGEKIGLKRWLHISAILAIGGGVLCLLSSMPGLDKSLGHEVQYWFALIGQCFYGVTYTIIQNLTTEIAETWFDAGERVLATSLLTIAFSFGLILGQGLTPQFIFCPEDVYLLNIVWAIPTILFSVLCLFTVTRDDPPTPPCLSRAKKLDRMDSMRSKAMMQSFRIFMKLDILLFIVCLAANNGFIIVLTSKTEQIICASGYSDQFGGLLIIIMVVSGWVAAGLLGYIVGQSGHMLTVGKVMIFFFTICIAVNTYVIRIPYQYYGLGVVFGLLGGFIFGGAPICMEVLAEVTYPAHQAISLSLFGLAACINSSVWLVIEGFMKGRELTEEELSIQTCNAHHNADSNDEFTCAETISSTNSTESNFGEEIAQEPKDYTLYLSCLTGFIALFNISMILFFNAPFKRSLANKTESKPAS